VLADVSPPALWYDALRPTTAQVLGTWQGGHLQGQAAVTLHRVGAGQVLYVGTYLAPETARWIADLALSCVPILPLLGEAPAEVEVSLRASTERKLLFLLNHGEAAHRLQGIPSGTELLQGIAVGGTLLLAPRQVAIIEMQG
jgi:beta-galactosidase